MTVSLLSFHCHGESGNQTQKGHQTWFGIILPKLSVQGHGEIAWQLQAPRFIENVARDLKNAGCNLHAFCLPFSLRFAPLSLSLSLSPLDPSIGFFTMDPYIGFFTMDHYIGFSFMDPFIRFLHYGTLYEESLLWILL